MPWWAYLLIIIVLVVTIAVVYYLFGAPHGCQAIACPTSGIQLLPGVG